MTPDESAWLGCVIAMLRAVETGEDAVASADDVLTRLRKRRETGALGPVAAVCPKCWRPAPLDLPHLCAPKPVRERLPDDVFEAHLRGLDEAHQTTESLLKEALGALNATLAAMRALRGLAFTGSRIPVERYPEKQAADIADEVAEEVLAKAKAAGYGVEL